MNERILYLVITDYCSGGTESYEDSLDKAIAEAKSATTRLGSTGSVYLQKFIGDKPVGDKVLKYSTHIHRVEFQYE